MQTKKQSLVETFTAVATGFITTMLLSPLIYWICGVQANIAQMGMVTLLFTVSSLIRGYIVRRFFNSQEHAEVIVASKETLPNGNVRYTIPVGNTTSEEAEQRLKEIVKDYKGDFVFPEQEFVVPNIEQFVVEDVVFRWKPILDTIGIKDNEKFFALYADHFAKYLASVLNFQSNDAQKDLMPINLRILSKVDFKGLVPEVAYLPTFKGPDRNLYEVSTYETKMKVGEALENRFVSEAFEHAMIKLIIKNVQSTIDKAVEDGMTHFYVYGMPSATFLRSDLYQQSMVAISRYTFLKL